MDPKKDEQKNAGSENMEFFLGKGINGNTLISDRNGLRSIEKIFESQNDNISINTFTGIERSIKIKKGSLNPSIKIVTTLGYVIEGSHNQPIMIRNQEGKYEWKVLSQIKETDHVTLQTGNECGKKDILSVDFILSDGYKTCSIPSNIDKDLCYLIGLLVGDGCYSKNHNDYIVEYFSDDAELLEIYQKIIKEKFSIECGTYYKSETFGKAYFCRKKIREFLLNCGLKYVTARQKEVPWVVLQNTLECQRAFLKGLYDTDGGVNSTCVHFTTASTILASQVHTMLLNLGIISTKSYTKSTDSWRISIYGRAGIKYYEQIGFYCNRKRDLLIKKYSETKTKIPKSNNNEIPGGNEIIKKLKKEIRSRGKMGDDLRPLLGSVISGNGKFRYNHLSYLVDNVKDIGKMGEVGNEILFMHENGILFDTVKEISYGECIMYDFEMEGQTFIGNGIVNHSSLKI